MICRSDSHVSVENLEGLCVRCGRSPRSICSVTVSSWYFGIYDNEPSNDFMTSERVMTEDPGEFAESWVVRKCLQEKRKDGGREQNAIMEVLTSVVE